MKKIKILLICFMLMPVLSGCWSYHELKDYDIVMGIGVDKAADDKINMTVQIALPDQIKTKSKGGEGGGLKAYWNIELEGETIFGTLRDYSHMSTHKLYFPHCKAVVFSRAYAEAGIRPCFDFLSRDPEPRGTVWMFVARDKIDDVFNAEPKVEKIPAVNLDELVEIQKYNAGTYTANLVKMSRCLLSKTRAPVLPFVELTGDKKDVLSITGGAVFKSDKLIGELDEKETRGLLWVEGEVKSGIVTVDNPLGEGKVDLEISRSSAEIKPEVKDGKVKITVKVRELANIGGQTTSDVLAVPDIMKQLGVIQNAAIKNEIEASVKKAKALKADVFGFGEEVGNKYPKEWKEMEDKWDAVFPHIEVEVIVDSEVYGAGIVPKPASPSQ